MKAIFRWELPLLAAALIALVLLATAPNARDAYADACAADATVSEGNLQFRFVGSDQTTLIALEGFSVNIAPDPRDETDPAVDVDDNNSEGDNVVPDSSGIEGRIDVNAACFTNHTIPNYNYDFVGSILPGSEAEEAGCLIVGLPDTDGIDDVPPDTYLNETFTGGDPNPTIYRFEVMCANVIVIKNATGANGAATFEFMVAGGGSPSDAAIDCNSDTFDLVPDPDSVQVGIICNSGGPVTIVESGLEAGWSPESVSCVATGDASVSFQGAADPNGPDNNAATLDVQINDLGEIGEDTITCTFVNTEDEPGGGIIDITKDVIGTDALFDFDFEGNPVDGCDDNSADFDLMDTDVESRDCDEGTYTFTENSEAGYTLTNIDCTGSTATIVITGSGVGDTDAFEEGDDTVEITLDDPTDFADCTFENTEDVVVEDGQIVIRKDVIGTDDDFGFSVGGDVAAECTPTAVSPDLGDGDFETFMCSTEGGPFTYTFTEDSLPIGYTLTDIDCTGSTAEVVISGSGVGDTDAFEEGDDTVEVTFDEADDAADCTFENTEDAAEEGNLRITIEKDDEDSEFDDEEFDFDISDGTAECDATSLNNINPGDSDFTDCDVQDDDEIEIEEDLPVDWEINDITCDEENIGSGGVTIDIDEDNQRVTITIDDETELDEGAEVICTFDNDPTGETTGDIVVRKDANGATSADDFDFDVTGDIDCTNEDFTLEGDGDSQGIDCDFDTVDSNDEIVIEEHNLPAGWRLVDINCDADDSGVDFDYDINGEDGGSVTISLPSDFESADQDIDCEFVNEEDAAPVVGPPARTQTVATLQTVGCLASQLINITVTDADGDPVANGTPVTVTASIGTVTPPATTTSNGGAVVLYTAPASTGGIALITAIAGGIVGQAQVVINCAPTPTPTTPPPPPPPPPPPAQDTGAGVIRPPSTGDAGLVDSKSSGWQLPALALLAVSLTVAGMTLVARRAD